MSLPHSFEDTLRLHTAAFHDWLGGLRVDYGGPADFPDGIPFKAAYPNRQNFPILRTLATRERQFANVVDLLVALRWIDTGTAKEMREKAEDFSVLPLPVALYEHGDFELDTTTASVPKRFARSQFNQATLKWESHQWPGTWWLPIRVTFWCKKRYTEVFIKEWVLSQLGKLGMADREVLLPVTHRAPWGLQYQTLQFDGVSDLSDLEGDPVARQIRFEMSFRLRMLHFKQGVVQSEPVNSKTFNVSIAQLGDEPQNDPLSIAPDLVCAPGSSDNLYTRYYAGSEIATRWPKSGAATVSESLTAPTGFDRRDVIQGTVRSVTDRIGIANRPVVIADAPHDLAFLSIGLRYKATAEVGLKLFQRLGSEDPASWTLARSVVLRATTAWVDLQLFAVLTQPVFSLVFEGRAISTQISFTDVVIRHLFSGSRVLPTGSSSVTGGTKYTWNGLSRSTTYLVVATTASVGSFTVRLDDDEHAPSNLLPREFDTTTDRGYAEQMQPKNASLALTLPTGFSPALVFLQPFAGDLRPRFV